MYIACKDTTIADNKLILFVVFDCLLVPNKIVNAAAKLINITKNGDETLL